MFSTLCRRVKANFIINGMWYASYKSQLSRRLHINKFNDCQSIIMVIDNSNIFHVVSSILFNLNIGNKYANFLEHFVAMTKFQESNPYLMASQRLIPQITQLTNY